MSAADLARRLEWHRVPQAPLAQAVADGRFGMIGSDHPSDNLSRHKLAALPGPYLLVVAANEGADRTACARYMREWARFAIVLDAEEPRAVYERIAALVPKHRKVLLVETVPASAASWLTFLACLPGGEFVP